jgi:hypothetical protein
VRRDLGKKNEPEIRLRRPAARRNRQITVTYTCSSGEQILQPGGDWEGEKRGTGEEMWFYL